MKKGIEPSHDMLAVPLLHLYINALEIPFLSKSDGSEDSELPPKINGKGIYFSLPATEVGRLSSQTPDTYSAEQYLYNN